MIIHPVPEHFHRQYDLLEFLYYFVKKLCPDMLFIAEE
jgi:hypothetical protein